MKKTILLILFFMSLLSISFAQENERWKEVCVFDDSFVYLDKSTWKATKTRDANYLVDCWFKAQKEDSFIISHMNYYTESLSFLSKDSYEYNNKGELIANWNSENLGWTIAPPTSKIERQLISTNQYIYDSIEQNLRKIGVIKY